MPRARSNAPFYALAASAAIGLAVAPPLVFFVAPVEPTMGFIQKIFYFHVPCAWSMFLAVMLAAVGGAALLFKERRWGDELLASATELAVVYGTLVLFTGPLWARKAWGHYWVWDVRLTTALVLYLIFVAVLLARRYGGPSRRRIAAGLALFGAADVPIVYLSVKLWRTIHPETTVVGSLPTGMRIAFFASLGVFTLLTLALLWVRLNLERSRNRIDDLFAAASETEP
jgi:heme exporter protein C